MLLGSSTVGCAVLSVEAQGLVNPDLARDGVSGSNNGKRDNDTYINNQLTGLEPQLETCICSPRGINSAGILRSLRRRWETVWPAMD